VSCSTASAPDFGLRHRACESGSRASVVSACYVSGRCILPFVASGEAAKVFDTNESFWTGTTPGGLQDADGTAVVSPADARPPGSLMLMLDMLLVIDNAETGRPPCELNSSTTPTSGGITLPRDLGSGSTCPGMIGRLLVSINWSSSSVSCSEYTDSCASASAIPPRRPAVPWEDFISHRSWCAHYALSPKTSFRTMSVPKPRIRIPVQYSNCHRPCVTSVSRP